MTQPAPTAGLLAHNVYFALHDGSPEARQRLLAACRQFLAPHPGIVLFACGTRAAELHREVNDLEFDVGLHMLFANQAAHDTYQDTEAHHQFIAENKHNWRHVRVFDSVVVTTPTAIG